MSDTNPIKIETGRLALRNPELGSFLMVEVVDTKTDRLGTYFIWDDTDIDPATEWAPILRDPATEWLPILRPGDGAVPEGSLLYFVARKRTQEMWPIGPDIDDDNAAMDQMWSHEFVALLRYGPEESTDD